MPQYFPITEQSRAIVLTSSSISLQTNSFLLHPYFLCSCYVTSFLFSYMIIYYIRNNNNSICRESIRVQLICPVTDSPSLVFIRVIVASTCAHSSVLRDYYYYHRCDHAAAIGATNMTASTSCVSPHIIVA